MQCFHELPLKTSCICNVLLNWCEYWKDYKAHFLYEFYLITIFIFTLTVLVILSYKPVFKIHIQQPQFKLYLPIYTEKNPLLRIITIY